MKRLRLPFNLSGDVGWLGILWVWSAAAWGYAAWIFWTNDWAFGATAMLLRCVGTLALGIGLCGLTRWGWSSAVCLAGFYSIAGAALALAASLALLMRPPMALSWKPFFLGLTVRWVFPLAICAAVASVIATAVLVLLWHGRAEFDVPHRRAFTMMVHEGLLPSVLVGLIDGFVVYTLWTAATSIP